jgi:5-methylcytosine-specific restriction endonuclease McrA
MHPDSLKQKVIELRKQNLGYRTIAKRLENKVPWKTIANWTSHIKIDWHKTHGNGIQKPKPLHELRSKTSIREYILRTRENVCENLDCGIAKWLGKKISLELDHIDGNSKNNIESNLRLLCPNCHSQTPTWRKKKTSL